MAEIKLTFLDIPFEDCARCVEVVKMDSNGRHRERFRLGVIEAEKIYEWIDNERPVQLARRYIKDFSLSDYRRSRGFEENHRIDLLDFDATAAYFDAFSENDFSFATFKGSSNRFTNASFSDGPLSFYHVRFEAEEVDFQACHFGSGIANFQFSEFNVNSLSFDESEFHSGDVLFISAQFRANKISFKNVRFGPGKTDFHYSKFIDTNLTFDKAHFGGGDVSFKRVDFGSGKIDFKRLDFGDGQVDFSECSLNAGRMNFRSASFGKGNINFSEILSNGDFFFDNAEFGSGSLSFYASSAKLMSFKYCHFNNHIDLRVKKAKKIDLSYTIVRDIIDLMPTNRSEVDLAEIDFSGMRSLGNLYIDWKENRVKSLILRQEKTNNRQKSEQFLILKESYNHTGRYADEDKAYVWYKRMELKADVEFALERNKLNGLWAYPTAFFKWLLFDKIGLYATEPLRVLFSVLVIYTTFSLLYLILPFIADTYIDTGADGLAELGLIAKSFYFSAITFLTVGYGDFYPVGIMRVFASLEGYVGVFLMGYFSVAFVRKVLR